MPESEVEISVGFEPHHREAAAALYWDAFGRKLEKAIGPRKQGIRLIEQGLDPSRAVAATQDGELVGLAGFQLDGRALTKIGCDVESHVDPERVFERILETE